MAYLTAACAVLASCQLDRGVSRGTEEAVDPLDKQAGSPYCGTQMPASPAWNHQPPPKPAQGEGYVMFRDPQNLDEWIAALGNPTKGTVSWAVRVNAVKAPADLGLLMHSVDSYGQLNVPHPCCQPPPPPVFPGGDYAALVLETLSREPIADIQSVGAAASCSQAD